LLPVGLKLILIHLVDPELDEFQVALLILFSELMFLLFSLKLSLILVLQYLLVLFQLSDSLLFKLLLLL